jgi:hypothetical protein
VEKRNRQDNVLNNRLPPHGEIYGSYDDNYPEGCPCKLSISDKLVSLDNLGVKIKMMKLTNFLEKTEIEFKNHHKNIESVSKEDCLLKFEEVICETVVKSLIDKEISVCYYK